MLDYAALSALAAVCRTGAFDKAAVSLGVTASAVSQRIKQLEERMGAALVLRGQPCRPTEAGARLIRHVDEVALLEAALSRDLAGPAGPDARPTIRLAVNADSLATWFVAALAPVDGVLFDLVLDDQDHSAEWLRRGEVSAAITGQARPAPGCDGVALGALRYLATASPAFAARWFPAGVTAEALARAPALTFNRKDALQERWVQALTGRRVALPSHWMASSHAFVDAALAGLGWGMNPEILVRRALADGRLVALASDRPLDTPLYWQWNRMIGAALAPLTQAVRAAAERHLVQPG